MIFSYRFLLLIVRSISIATLTPSGLVATESGALSHFPRLAASWCDRWSGTQSRQPARNAFNLARCTSS